MARRDARRYKWRSALIVVMVGLPVLLLTGGITLMATNDVSLAESVPRVMGSAQARVFDTSGGDQSRRMIQSANGLYTNGRQDNALALAVPGFAPDSVGTTGKVQRVTGGRVIETVITDLRVTLGDRRPSMPVLGIDARDPMARGMTELVSGRWASNPSEIVVTQAGIANGLPRGGLLTSSGGIGKPTLLTVVGVATGQIGDGRLPFLVALPDLATDLSADPNPQVSFLVERANPVNWSDVRALNDYGFLVKSREVFVNPPSAAELDPEVVQSDGSHQRQIDLVLLLASVGLFIETTLLAGPAFAVSAARQRRSLALAASNGAEARQLRRYVLGQAVVLGVVSAALAVVAGVLLTLAGLTWWKAGHADFGSGPFEVSWPRVVGVLSCAVVASVVAALLPAKGIARLDIVSVLTGRSGDRRVRRGLPVAGIVLMGVSGAALIWSVAAAGQGGIGLGVYLIVGGSVGLVLGCLMVIPVLLILVGRLGTHLVLPLRLAARDTARQRGRSTPAVAAIMAAVAVLTTLSIAAASYEGQRQLEYRPQQVMGTAFIAIGAGRSDGGRAAEVATNEREVRSVVAHFGPQLSVDREGSVVYPQPMAASTAMVSWAAPVPADCTEAQILAAFFQQPGDIVPCQSLVSRDSNMQVAGLDRLMARFTLSTAQQAVLRAGGALTTDGALVRNGKISYVAGTAMQDRSGVTTGGKITQRTSFSAVLLSPRVGQAASESKALGAWILTGTASRLGWPVETTSLYLASPTGMISPEEERAVADRLGNDFSLYVERGYQNESRVQLLILFAIAGLLVLVASLISTALSLAESQNDMSTLAAVGATRHTRRGVAAAQAFVVATCGCLLGVAVGMVPGIASTWPLTVRFVSAAGRSGQSGEEPLRQIGPLLQIPWLPLLGLVLLVPVFAGTLAWIAVRRYPQMTRRLS